MITAPMTTDRLRSARRWMFIEMLPHVWIGHPVAAVLSLLRQRDLAERFHYATLPRRIRRRLGGSCRFDHGAVLAVHDFTVAPLTATLRALGTYDAAQWVFDLLATPAALACDACGSGGAYRKPLPPDPDGGKVCKMCGHDKSSHTWLGRYPGETVWSCSVCPRGTGGCKDKGDDPDEMWK